MSSSKENVETIELTIFDLGSQGDGVAHANGTTFFVPGALPGEKVLVKPVPKADGSMQTALVDILTPSPTRKEPSCPHFPVCGGCRMQHLGKDDYTKWKVHRLRHDLAKEGLNDILHEAPLITQPHTRRRARFAAEHTPKGIRIGFNAWRSHDIVDLAACSVLVPEIVLLVQKLKAKLEIWLPMGQDCDIQVTSLPGGLDVVLMGGPSLGLDERQSLALLAEALDVAQLSWRKWDRSPIEPIAYRTPLSVTYGSTRVAFPAASFLQATEQSEKDLIDFARKAIGDSASVLDLFSGLGGFGLSMEKAKKVVFADIDGPAIESLAKAIRGKERVEAVKRNLIGDPFTTGECNNFDAVIFDPPRGGSKAQAGCIAASAVPNVVAISCDPPSFARDAKILMDGGYQLRTLLPVDQFLWSTHLEIAAHFSR